jgi:hypothetical protein
VKYIFILMASSAALFAQGTTQVNGPRVVGQKLSNFNGFDQSTANGASLFLGLNPPVFWSPLIGLQEQNNTSPTFSVGGYFQSTATNSSGVMQNVIGGFGEADGFPTGSGSIAFLGGLEGLTELHSGTATIQAGHTSYLRVDLGTTATNLIHYHAQPAVILGTVTNHYGLYLPDITGGTAINQAIHTGLGWNMLGDALSIGNSIASRPPNLFTVKGTGAGYLAGGQLSDAATFGCLVFNNTACATTNYHVASDGTDLRLNSPANTVITSVNNVAKWTSSSTVNASTVPIAEQPVLFSALGAVPAAGRHVWCSDCVQALVCAGSGSGAFAISNGTNWTCGASALTVSSNGTGVGSRSTLNFIAGTGISNALVDTGTQINVTQSIDTTQVVTTKTGTIQMPAGGCNNGGTFSTQWVMGGTQVGQCSNYFPMLNLAASGTSNAVYWFRWPTDFNNAGAANAFLTFTDMGGAGGNVKLDLSIACVAANTTTSTPATFNTLTSTGSYSVTSTGLANTTKELTVAGLSLTGCSPGTMAALQINRDNSVSGNSADALNVIGATLGYARN